MPKIGSENNSSNIGYWSLESCFDKNSGSLLTKKSVKMSQQIYMTQLQVMLPYNIGWGLFVWFD